MSDLQFIGAMMLVVPSVLVMVFFMALFILDELKQKGPAITLTNIGVTVFVVVALVLISPQWS